MPGLRLRHDRHSSHSADTPVLASVQFRLAPVVSCWGRGPAMGHRPCTCTSISSYAMAHRLRILTLVFLVLGATTAVAGPRKDAPVEAGQATLADPTAVLDDIQQ